MDQETPRSTGANDEPAEAQGAGKPAESPRRGAHFRAGAGALEPKPAGRRGAHFRTADGEPPVHDAKVAAEVVSSLDLPPEPTPEEAAATEHRRVGRRRKKHMSKTAKRVLVGVLVAIVLVCAGAGAVWAVGKNNMHQEAVDIQAAADAVPYDEGKTIEYKGHKYVYNEDVVSIDVIGFDRRESDVEGGRNGQADAIMVVALDTKTGKTTCIAVPRDAMIDVSTFVGDSFKGIKDMQACLAFSYGTDTQQGADYVTTAVSRTLYNMPIKYYFALDMQSVGPLADLAGGVVVDALQTIPGTNIVEGQQVVLTGEEALKYVQWRDTSVEGSARMRQKRQVQFLQAYAQQVLARKDLSLLTQVFNVGSKYGTTNLGLSEFTYLGSCLINNGVGSIDVVTLPGELVQGPEYEETHLDMDAVYQTVLDVYYTRVD